MPSIPFDPKIMIDLPGNKVRTRNLSESIRLSKGESFHLADFNLNYPEFGNHLKGGDIIHANDSIYTLEVDEVSSHGIKIISHS